jgi:hypothetical protein
VDEVSSIKELPTVGTVMLVEKDGSRLGSIPLPASAGGSRQSLLLGLDKILQKQELAAVLQSKARPQADNLVISEQPRCPIVSRASPAINTLSPPKQCKTIILLYQVFVNYRARFFILHKYIRENHKYTSTMP